MAKSIKKNFVFNLINTLSSFVFPLITFPYASRVIMPEGIGQANFYNSIISYIVLLTGLGIPMYGIREIARVRDDIKKRSITVCEILSLNLLLTLIGYVAVAVIACVVPEVKSNIPLFLVLSIAILLNAIGCPWFYSGIEEFKYITIRGLVVKLLSIPFLFIFVKSKEDLLLYGIYLILATVGNSLINFFRLRKHVDIHVVSFKDLNIRRHVRPALDVFVFYLVTSIYLNLDKVMLGLLSDNASVGYYTSASSLAHLLSQLIVSLGVVLLPRLSNLYANAKLDEFNALATKSYNVVSFFSFPLFFGLILMAETLINLFSGPAFHPAITTVRLIAPILLVLPISNLIGLQILYPQGHIGIVTKTCCVGAVVNFTFNMILIPLYSQDGAAIATILAETSVTISQLLFAKKYIPFRIFSKSNALYFIAAVIMTVVGAFMMKIQIPDIARLFLIPTVCALVYCICLVSRKEPLSSEILGFILHRKQILNK